MRATKPFEPKFAECRDCRFFRASLARPECLECDSGEFFELKTKHLEAGMDDGEEYNQYLKDVSSYE